MDSRIDDITVVGAGPGLPFSKGILSQSLLAAAIDPRDAFEIAREIESELRTTHSDKIERGALRDLTRRVLERRTGPEEAARYLAWRQYENPETPVFLLLSGTSGVGKTTLALEVARRMGIGRVQSTDSIRQVMRLMISRELMPWIHASSFDAYQHLGFKEETPENVLAGFKAQASAVSMGVRASLDRAVEESANLIIDGVSLIPGSIDPMLFAGRAIVVFCVVATLDEQSLHDRFVVRAQGQRHRLAHRYLDHFEGILAIQRHVIKEAELRGFPVIDNVDSDKSARALVAHVVDAIRAKPRTGLRNNEAQTENTVRAMSALGRPDLDD